MSILKIALTGGIACGKSSVGQIFKKNGVAIIDLDVIARQIVEPNSKSLSALVSKFSNSILNADKTLNRSKMRQKMLENPINQVLVEKILHPKILQKMHAQIDALDAKLVVVEVPLLVEQNMAHLFERVIVVDCSEENQLKRLLKRDNINKAIAKKMLAAQASQEQRLALGKKLPIDIIENNADTSTLEKTVNRLLLNL